MWPFKKRHVHDWELIDKRTFKQAMEQQSIFHKPFEFVVEGVAELKRCRSCGLEEAGMWPIQKDWFATPLRDHFGSVDPFWYRSEFGIKDKS